MSKAEKAAQDKAARLFQPLVDWPPPFGRPTDYRAEFGPMLIEHARKPGGTLQAFAAAIGQHRDTLLEWSREYPDFKHCYKLAKEIQECVLFNLGVQGMMGAIPFFNAGSWIFAMKARFGLHEDGPRDQEDDNDMEFTE